MYIYLTEQLYFACFLGLERKGLLIIQFRNHLTLPNHIPWAYTIFTCPKDDFVVAEQLNINKNEFKVTVVFFIFRFRNAGHVLW